MADFQVSANGTIFGFYEGDTAQDARDACARDAGYKSEADMVVQLDAPSDLTAENIAEAKKFAIYGQFSHLNDTNAGIEAIEAYIAAIRNGIGHDMAEMAASNILHRAGYGVNHKGGVSIRIST